MNGWLGHDFAFQYCVCTRFVFRHIAILSRLTRRATEAMGERFVALVREAMAGSIKKGEPMPAVKIHHEKRRKTQKSHTPEEKNRENGPVR